MDPNDVKLQKIMAEYCPYAYHQIQLTVAIKNKYVPEEFKDNFSNDVCNAWANLNRTEIYNAMFESLKTGNDIIAKIPPVQGGANVIV